MRGDAKPRSQKLQSQFLGLGTTFRPRKHMGKFDSRHSQKMTRRKGQRKKKARLKRRAEAARASRTTKKPATKKKAASAASSA